MKFCGGSMLDILALEGSMGDKSRLFIDYSYRARRLWPV
jgi:hypothetical protein